MKKLLTTCLLLIGLIGTTNLAAENGCCNTVCGQNHGLYVGALGGPNWMNIDSFKTYDVYEDETGEYYVEQEGKAKLHTKTGFMVGGVVGYKFCPLYANDCFAVSPRVEAEITYRQNKTSHISFDGYKIHVGITSHKMAYMANALFDFDNTTPVTPFIGGGIGYAHSWLKGHKEDKFAYQGIAGLNYAVCEQVELSVDYHFLKGMTHTQDHALCFGVKKYF